MSSQKSKAELLKDNLLIPCQSKIHLAMWFKTYLQVDLLDCVVSRFANTSPLDAAYEMYSYAFEKKNRAPLNVFYIASRGSQKTLLVAAVEIALLLHDKRDILHFAGSKDQVEACYKYVKDFLQRPYVRDLIQGRVTADGAKLLIPDYTGKSSELDFRTYRLFPITPLSVQGQHAPGLFVDELLTLKFDKLKAYKDLSGIPVPMNDGRPYLRGEISSRKGAFSLVESKLASAAKTGLKIRSWTAFEMTEKCQDERSGTEEAIYYTNPFKGAAYTEDQFVSMADTEKLGFSEVKALDKCGECKLLPFCNGDLKKQKSTSKYLRTIESVISEFEINSLEWILSQKMSLMPSAEGLIYGKFKKDTHIKNAKEIWEIASKEVIDYVPTVSQLVEKLFQLGCRSYAGIDHTGGSAPAAVIIGFVDKQSNIYLLGENYEAGQELDDLIAVLGILHNKYRFSYIFPDPASVDKNKIIKKHFSSKCQIIDNFKKDIDAGIEAVRAKVMNSTGAVSMYLLDTGTENMQNEFSKYHYEESGSGEEFLPEPAEEFSHLQDALRYMCQNLFLKGNGLVAAEYSGDEIKSFIPMAGLQPIDQVNLLIQNKIKEIIDKNTENQDIKVHNDSGFFWSID